MVILLSQSEQSTAHKEESVNIQQLQLTMSYSNPKGLRALVFGASGITGWGIVNTALSYPTPDTFDQVIGLTNRPLSKEAATFPDDARLKLYSGVNLSQSVEEIAKALKDIEAIEKTTHVYFSGRFPVTIC